MAYPPRYRFSRREIDRHKCLDCGVNVIRNGDYCMLQPEIWDDQFKLGWNDNLCLACIERRLGRRITFDDLMLFVPQVEGYPRSPTLASRLAPKPKRRRRKR